MRCDTFTTLKDAPNTILLSAKWKIVYSKIVLTPAVETSRKSQSTNASPLMCPTRWSACTKSMQVFLETYVRIRASLSEINEASGSISDGRRATTTG